MNHFDTLSDAGSDDLILSIFSYLPCKELLALSRVDKKFNRIITESETTKAKIPLIVDFKQGITVGDVTQVARKRQFTVLKLKNVKTNVVKKFSPLLRLLSASVEHLIILGSEFKEEPVKIQKEDFRDLLQMFFSKLKKCEVYDVILDSKSKLKVSVVVTSPPNHLKYLGLDTDEMLKFFAACRQLKSFNFSGKCRDAYFYFFLTQQKNLKELHITCNRNATIRVDLSRINCPNLKELSLPAGAEPTTSEFLKKQPDLTALGITISDQDLLHPIMKTICNAPKLVELDIEIKCKIPATPMPRLENHTVKRLEITESSEAIGWLLQIFRGADSIDLFYDKMYHLDANLDVNLHDLSNVPLGSIDKIKFLHAKKPFHIQFSPAAVPVNGGSFESAVTKFAEKFSAEIGSIVIGHKNWSESVVFKLSSSFCNGLVSRLPKLNKLELFNVADRGKFLSFLENNRNIRKNLEKVKIHKPNDDEPGSKKMKFEVV